MKKLVVLLGLLALAAFPAMAATTNYHYNENMNCSDCHSMHASAHNNLTDGSAITTPRTTFSSDINPYYPAPNAGGGVGAPGRHYLLKNDDVCASCHDGQNWAPDVIGVNVNGYIRSAGGVRTATENTGGGHMIGSTVVAPGSAGMTVQYSYTELECATCHSPHGGTGYRNLVGYSIRNATGIYDAVPATNSANVAKVTPTVAKTAAFDGTKDVTIVGADAYTFGSGALQNYYGRANILYSNNTGPITFNGATSSNHMDQFCGICHGAFHGGSDTDVVGDGTGFVRHPTSTVKIADGSHGSPNTWNNGDGALTLKVYQAAAATDALNDSPGCLTCHKAHGNLNPFALVFPDRTTKTSAGVVVHQGGTVPSEEGGGIYKDLCKSCHGMGGL